MAPAFVKCESSKRQQMRTDTLPKTFHLRLMPSPPFFYVGYEFVIVQLFNRTHKPLRRPPIDRNRNFKNFRVFVRMQEQLCSVVRNEKLDLLATHHDNLL
jgi:hypothetical protein